MNPLVKVRLFYALMVFFVVVVIIQMGMFVAHQIWGISMQGMVITNVLFNLIISYTISRIIWRMSRQWYLSRKWLNIFRSNTHTRLTKQLNYKYRSWRTEIIVVEDSAFLALTIGMLRPKIVVSTAVFKLFNQDEAEAILLHEWYHCRNQDNLKMFISTLLVDAFGYLPIIKPIFHYYKTWKELLADRFAIKQMGTELHLGNVLLKLVNAGNLQQRAVGVYFAETALHYRIMQILEPDQTVNVPIALFRPLLVSLSFLLLFMVGGSS